MFNCKKSQKHQNERPIYSMVFLYSSKVESCQKWKKLLYE